MLERPPGVCTAMSCEVGRVALLLRGSVVPWLCASASAMAPWLCEMVHSGAHPNPCSLPVFSCGLGLLQIAHVACVLALNLSIGTRGSTCLLGINHV